MSWRQFVSPVLSSTIISSLLHSLLAFSFLLLGEEYSYSNTNYTLLGLVIETVTQNKVANEIRKRILEPLGMNNTYLEHHEACPEEGHTKKYHWATPPFLKDAGMHPEYKEVPGHPYLIDVSVGNISIEYMAGGLVTCATDLVKFADALGKPGRLLEPEFYKQMFNFHEPQNAKSAVRKYMQGVIVDEHYGKSLYHHWGSTLGYLGFMGFFDLPDGPVSFCFLVNAGIMHAFPNDVGLEDPRSYLPVISAEVLKFFGEELV
eukprot:TRINITY_DN6592_c0_g1_i2.p1 TRINITY_DN6592_c0_g1~~TRINITY_DN6592_c0_g1_i2.p1  ORF type:complete len:261 (-),score=38.80 TRINITY_DN6592_c0_g1_i2:94-876(-)